MITSVKDEVILRILIDKLKDSNKTFICTLCGETMDIHPTECPRCHFKNK